MKLVKKIKKWGNESEEKSSDRYTERDKFKKELEEYSKDIQTIYDSPAIDGCDIWEIKKDNIRKFFVEPKKYSWRDNDDKRD